VLQLKNAAEPEASWTRLTQSVQSLGLEPLTTAELWGVLEDLNSETPGEAALAWCHRALFLLDIAPSGLAVHLMARLQSGGR
jgi:hypothetical protein